jgi:hypothetical protein
MTLSDLVFLLSVLALIGSAVRVVYLFARSRKSAAARLARRIGGGVAVYSAALLLTALVEPERTIALGVPQCFDDFCIAVDSATRRPGIGDAAAPRDFLVVSGRVISKAGGRRQREADVYGAVLDGQGHRFAVSERGQETLRRLGLAGSNMTDFVDPATENTFRLAFEVPSDAQSLAFVTRHGAFPNALIIGNPESPFHKPVIVPLFPHS